MPFSTVSKQTKRFTYTLNSNDTAKKAGSNTLVISSAPVTDGYSSGGTQITMSHREAKALNLFLNNKLVSDDVVID